MADREFTLLEFHVHSHGDVSVAPDVGGEGSMASRLLGRRETASGERTRGRSGGTGGGGSSPLLAAGAVLVVAAAAFVLRRLRTGDASRAEQIRQRTT